MTAQLALVAFLAPQPDVAALAEGLPKPVAEKVRAAARTTDPVARELLLEAALADTADATPPAHLGPRGPGARLSPAVRRLLAHAQGRTGREQTLAFLLEAEAAEARCAPPKGVGWAAFSTADALCGGVALAAMARSSRGEPEALRAALARWDGLARWCPGIDVVMQRLHEWAPPDRAAAVERRCLPPKTTLRPTPTTTAPALAFAWAAEARLQRLGTLTKAHTVALQSLLGQPAPR